MKQLNFLGGVLMGVMFTLATILTVSLLFVLGQIINNF